MKSEGNSEQNDSIKVPGEFPDRESCKVKPSNLGGYFECLSRFWSHCSHCMTFGELRFCRHPAAEVILDWSI